MSVHSRRTKGPICLSAVTDTVRGQYGVICLFVVSVTEGLPGNITRTKFPEKT